ncbi:patr class I histocompatibility antigen, alpha chain G-like [Tachysurus vachellii]|uniref:patr class I histocompatibility antigen, alpha chain G-like n=1 Tax=Tachysurus vachellii TaxID=175792 RepID=UPI00296B200E|nr:patr class I histocompatibility antigen, alpha chain G-like [Tachysurus vachellii]
MITWRKDGEDVHEDVELRETLPNQDGSFQKRSILKVPAEELQKHTYTCVIQHSSLEKKELVLNVSERQILKGTHSLQYFYTVVTTEMNFPEFTAVGLVDGGQFVYYDSNIRRMIPKTEWIQKMNYDDPDYWNRETQKLQGSEEIFKVNVDILMMRFNQTTGVHSVQLMYGCELDDDGTVRGYRQYGYDGEDYISFDLKTVTWTAAKSQAVITKNKWDPDPGMTVARKNYLENICIKWLKKYVSYGKETLERKVRPETSLFQKESSSPEVVCHATGFFPKAVMITWRKDGEDMHEDVELRETLPNQDGSFQKRSILKVPAEELQKHTYTCVIQHSSLEKELVLHLRNKQQILKVRPETSLFQKESSSPEVVCHATGFFPKAVMITWRKDGEDVHEDVELRETLPNHDGSFQKRSILKVPAEELQKHTYTCVIQHSSLEKELVLHVSERQILKDPQEERK